MSVHGKAFERAVDAVFRQEGLEGRDAVERLREVRWCRRCGCTDWDACDVVVRREGEEPVSLGPCGWVTPRLCTGCATLAELLASDEAGIPWLMHAIAGLVCEDDGVELSATAVQIPWLA